jgi:FkbM family methyltransferase
MTDLGTHRVVEADGLRWVVRPGTDDRLAPQGHEMPLRPIVEAFCPPGGVFIDVGAHVGGWAIRMASTGRVVTAIEPCAETFVALEANAALNPSPRLQTLHLAAWDSEGHVSLENAHGLASGGSTRATEATSAPSSEIARALPLDSILAKLYTPPGTKALIKIDTEGNEDKVIKGGALWISAHRPTLLVELHGRPYNDPDLDARALQALKDASYVHGDRVQYGGCDYLLAFHESAVPRSNPRP